MDELKNLIEESSAESQVKMKDQLETLIGIPLKQMMLKIAVSLNARSAHSELEKHVQCV